MLGGREDEAQEWLTLLAGEYADGSYSPASLVTFAFAADEVEDLMAEEAIRPARILRRLLPGEWWVAGVLALMLAGTLKSSAIRQLLAEVDQFPTVARIRSTTRPSPAEHS